MCTALPSALRNINLQARATSHALITPHSNLCSPTPRLRAPRPPRSASTPPTTTFLEL